ncbi:MAG TPA: hypothetical protein VM369_11795 [Candidatus Binatia bacterium]|nr:hypothetical protein [Candidatus Binatia bacterium]
MLNRKNAVLALALAAACAGIPAHAAEQAGERVVVGIGMWIADQGNRALQDIRQDLQRELNQHVSPAVPPVRREPTARTTRQRRQ